MTDFKIDSLKPLCQEFGLEITAQISERLNTYGNFLLSWNQKMNLTAITEPQEVLFKHFFDCLLFFKAVNIPQNARVVDVGTGAGFPGMVLKIVRNDIDITLLDGLNKRLTFLNAVAEELGLSVDTVHMRAEDAGRSALHRERYDIVCARAVAALPTLCEYCIPLVKKGGLFVAMKGSGATDEAASAANAISILGGEKPDIICETLTGNEKRAFIISKKISQTPPKYPRTGGKIAKSAL